MNNDKADFTQGSILKKLIAFMIPVLGALILQAAYGAVDLLVVGRFGSTSGLSAVSTGSQVLNLVTFVVIQFAMGITVLIARYLGEKKPQQIGAVVGGASIVFTIISAVLFVVMVFLPARSPFSCRHPRRRWIRPPATSASAEAAISSSSPTTCCPPSSAGSVTASHRFSLSWLPASSM